MGVLCRGNFRKMASGVHPLVASDAIESASKREATKVGGCNKRVSFRERTLSVLASGFVMSC
jgi:hypothetical protein